MSDDSALVALVQSTLTEIAKQSSALGHGLQIAAPADRASTANNSIDYLLSVAEALTSAASECGKLDLLQITKNAVQHDMVLREQYQIASKFRFIQDRLAALLTGMEEAAAIIVREKESKEPGVKTEDEVLVCVYLYNAQGMILQTWQKMLSPAVFYEYSVNRPIYSDKEHIDVVIRNKPNKMQHAYLSVYIKKRDIISGENTDSYGHPLLKIREGALRFDRLISFTHNLIDYLVSEAGVFTKKEV
jgi:hypothetical protein